MPIRTLNSVETKHKPHSWVNRIKEFELWYVMNTALESYQLLKYVADWLLFGIKRSFPLTKLDHCMMTEMDGMMGG